MNARYCKPTTPDEKREPLVTSKSLSGSVKESPELHRVLERVRNALIRLESELIQLEGILDAAHRRADQDEQDEQDEQERIQ